MQASWCEGTLDHRLGRWLDWAGSSGAHLNVGSQLGLGAALVHDSRPGEGASGCVGVEHGASQVGNAKTAELLPKAAGKEGKALRVIVMQ